MLGRTDERAEGIPHFGIPESVTFAENLDEFFVAQGIDAVRVLHQAAHLGERRHVESRFGEHLVDGPFADDVRRVGTSDSNLAVEFDVAREEQPVAFGEHRERTDHRVGRGVTGRSAVTEQRVLEFVVCVDRADLGVEPAHRGPLERSAVSQALRLGGTVFDVVLVYKGMAVAGDHTPLCLAKESVDLEERLVGVVPEEGEGVVYAKERHPCHVELAARLFLVAKDHAVHRVGVSQGDRVGREVVPGVGRDVRVEFYRLAVGRLHVEVGGKFSAESGNLEQVLEALAVCDGVVADNLLAVAVRARSYIMVVAAEHHVTQDGPRLGRILGDNAFAGFAVQYANLVGRLERTALDSGYLGIGGQGGQKRDGCRTEILLVAFHARDDGFVHDVDACGTDLVAVDIGVVE